MPWLKPVRAWEKTPVAVPPSAKPLITGFAAVSYTVPRSSRESPPSEVMFAPRVALVWPIEVAVGEVSVGATADAVTAPYTTMSLPLPSPGPPLPPVDSA